MAYDKVYPQQGQSVLAFDSNQEDRVGAEFSKLGNITIDDFTSFSNGWNSPVGSWLQPRAITQDGWVTLQGMVTNGTANQIMTLPERLRPAKAHTFVVAQGATTVTIQITNQGVVQLVPTSPTRVNVHLDGMRWRVS